MDPLVQQLLARAASRDEALTTVRQLQAQAQATKDFWSLAEQQLSGRWLGEDLLAAAQHDTQRAVEALIPRRNALPAPVFEAALAFLLPHAET